MDKKKKKSNYDRQRRLDDPVFRAASNEQRRVNQLRARYGIGSEEYLKMFKSQNGVCAICGQPEYSKKRINLCVDHDHVTGAIRGLLCHRCNAGIGQLNDDVALLEAALNYLKEKS